VIRLSDSLAAWGTPGFKTILRKEIESLDISELPLIQAMRQGSVPLEDRVDVSILSVSESDDAIHVRAGLFFKSLIAGCACANDPTPENENNEYCEVDFDIDKSTAETAATLLAGD